MNDITLYDEMVLHPTRTKKLNALADAIDKIEVLDDGSLYIKTINHLIIESEGNQVMYSKNGEIVIKSKILHLNPGTPIYDIKDTTEYIDRIHVDADAILKLMEDGIDG